jgi:hypothetical protein
VRTPAPAPRRESGGPLADGPRRAVPPTSRGFASVSRAILASHERLVVTADSDRRAADQLPRSSDSDQEADDDQGRDRPCRADSVSTVWCASPPADRTAPPSSRCARSARSPDCRRPARPSADSSGASARATCRLGDQLRRPGDRGGGCRRRRRRACAPDRSGQRLASSPARAPEWPRSMTTRLARRATGVLALSRASVLRGAGGRFRRPTLVRYSMRAGSRHRSSCGGPGANSRFCSSGPMGLTWTNRSSRRPA